LPSRIAGIGLGEAFGDDEAVAIGVQRLGQGALLLQHISHLVIGDREIALPSRIAGIGLGEACLDFQCPLIASQSFRKVSLGIKNDGNESLGHREIALPAAIAGIGLSEALAVPDRSQATFGMTARGT
jgi:hypothetical protein